GVRACRRDLLRLAAFRPRRSSDLDALRRTSGTGGFAVLGESTLPVVQDLNTRSGRNAFGLDAQELAGVNVVPMRVHDGDEASCLDRKSTRLNSSHDSISYAVSCLT